MRKSFFCFLFSFAFSKMVLSQIVAEDAKGESSILYKNSDIGFNLTEAALSASINNFRKIHVAQRKDQFLWQIGATGKNEEGLGVLWNEGNLKASSKLEGFIGFRFRGYHDEYEFYRQIKTLNQSNNLVQWKDALNFLPDLKLQIDADATLSPALRRELKDTISKISKTRLFDLAAVHPDLVALAAGYGGGKPLLQASLNNTILPWVAARIASIAALEPNALIVREQIADLNRQADEFLDSHPKRIFTVFLNFGMNSSEYNLYSRPLDIPFSSRFDTSKFRGGFIDLGFNYDFGPHWVVGISVGYEKANTFDSLSKKEYTERTSETSGQQSFVSEKKYTAYTGLYTKYDRANIKTDLLYFGKISGDFRYVWNILYSRFYLPINQNNVKGIITLGTGVNFYKKDGKFVGGLYLQQEDLTNNLEAENSSFWKRLSLGVTTKFSFLSIFDRK